MPSFPPHIQQAQPKYIHSQHTRAQLFGMSFPPPLFVRGARVCDCQISPLFLFERLPVKKSARCDRPYPTALCVAVIFVTPNHHTSPTTMNLCHARSFFFKKTTNCPVSFRSVSFIRFFISWAFFCKRQTPCNPNRVRLGAGRQPSELHLGGEGFRIVQIAFTFALRTTFGLSPRQQA